MAITEGFHSQDAQAPYSLGRDLPQRDQRRNGALSETAYFPPIAITALNATQQVMREHHLGTVAVIDHKQTTDEGSLLSVLYPTGETRQIFTHLAGQALLDVDYETMDTETMTHEITEHITHTAQKLQKDVERNEWETFNMHFSSFTPEEQSDIELAYITAQYAHRGQTRKSGERYFSHPRACALILKDAGVTWPQPIILALLHDVQEDTDFFEMKAEESYPGEERGWDNVGTIFGLPTSNMLNILTELDVDDGTGVSPEIKKATEQLYHDGFVDCHPDILLTKLADRVHNIRTLGAMPPDKQRKKIYETQEIYLPLFDQLFDPTVLNPDLHPYHAIATRLLHQLHDAIREATVTI